MLNLEISTMLEASLRDIVSIVRCLDEIGDL